MLDYCPEEVISYHLLCRNHSVIRPMPVSQTMHTIGTIVNSWAETSNHVIAVEHDSLRFSWNSVVSEPTHTYHFFLSARTEVYCVVHNLPNWLCCDNEKLSRGWRWLGGYKARWYWAHSLTRFRGPAGAKLLAKRGSLVVRTLAEILGGQKVLSALSANLEDETNIQFAANVVQALNFILLTTPEVIPDHRLKCHHASWPIQIPTHSVSNALICV